MKDLSKNLTDFFILIKLSRIILSIKNKNDKNYRTKQKFGTT